MRYMQNKQYVRFEESIVKVKYPNKINQSKFLDVGNYPIVSQEERLISGYWNDEHDVFWNPTAVVIFGDHTRVLKYIDFDFVVGADGIKILKPIDQLNAKYFYYQLLSFNIDAIGYARHYRLLKEKTIKIPPLAEQQRIVARLDAAFAAIDEASAAAEANLRNARALFDSYLDQVFSTLKHTEISVALEEVAEEITDGDHMPPPKSEHGIPFVTIGNINKTTHTLDFSDTYFVPTTYYDAIKSSRKPQKGDVLYTVTGSFGIPVLVDTERKFCFQRHIALIRPKKFIEHRWLYYSLLSPDVKQQAEAGATGTAQKTVSLKLLRSLKIPHVDHEKQLTYIKVFDELNHITQHSCALYQQKIALLAELKQALLAEVFE